MHPLDRVRLRSHQRIFSDEGQLQQSLQSNSQARKCLPVDLPRPFRRTRPTPTKPSHAADRGGSSPSTNAELADPVTTPDVIAQSAAIIGRTDVVAEAPNTCEKSSSGRYPTVPFTTRLNAIFNRDRQEMKSKLIEADESVVVSPTDSDLESRDVELGLSEEEGGSDPLERVRSKLSIQDQSSRLPFKQLIIVFVSLGVSLLLAFLDQTSVSTALPSIAREFDAASDASWVGTSFLIANTSMQILYGRLSDVFGRKAVLMSAISLFAIGNLLCGFAQSMVQLIIFRGISGAGGGGIISLAMIIVSDIVSLKERGKYQGILGSCIAVGSGVGPLIGALFSENVSWRWVFRFSVPFSVLIMIQIYFFLPLTKVSGNMMSKLKKIDYVGSLISLGATVFVLVPVSGGGFTYAWKSPIVIVLLTLGGLLYIVFCVFEAKVAKLPIMPMHMFTIRSVALVLAQTFLVGIVYYANLYYLPVFFQVLQSRSIIMSGALLLPLIITQTFTATGAGIVLAKTGKYNPVIWAGFALWTLGLGLQTTFSPDISLGKIVGYLIVEGWGIGMTFQTTLVAAQATSPAKDRAVVTGARNFFRTIGGAFGLAICGAIMNNVLDSRLSSLTDMSPELRQEIIRSSLDLPKNLTSIQIETVTQAYADGIRAIFIMDVPLGGLCFLMALFVEDKGLTDDKPKEVKTEDQAETVNKEVTTPPAKTMDDVTVPETMPKIQKLEEERTQDEEHVMNSENLTEKL